jgi:hypothetical protein
MPKYDQGRKGKRYIDRYAVMENVFGLISEGEVARVD